MAEYTNSKDSIFRQVASQAKIADVIAFELGANALIKKGKDYVCLCPFHHDHSPSMQISVSRNTFKCWVDKKGGDPINFVEEYEHLSKWDALKRVCEICHIPLPDSVKNRKEYVSPIETLYKEELNALLEVKKFYQIVLLSNEGEECREYLKKRKIPQEAIDHFELGFAPSDPTRIIQLLRKQGYRVPTLERAGILSNATELKDRFSYRLMYPIHDDYGHLVGFSGRKIREETDGGKYINYPATPLFRKSEILYHYDKAKLVARKAGCIYVVEGFNDVIAFQRAGMENCVGSMGTALTEENLQSLKRLGVPVRLCLDRDEPGQNAEEACLPLLLKAQIPFLVVRPFKGGKDADEVLANFDPNGKEELIKESSLLRDPFMFLLARTMVKNSLTSKMTDSLLINSFLDQARSYYQILDEVSKVKDIQQLSAITDISTDELKHLLEEKIPQKENQNQKDSSYKNYKRNGDRSRFRPRDRQDQNPEPKNLIAESNLPSSFHTADYFIELITQAQNTLEGKLLNPTLISNETQIMSVLPHSRSACSQFQEMRCDFLFSPYYPLSCIIIEMFEKHPEKDSFASEDYQLLQDFISHYQEKRREVQEKEKEEKPKENSDVGFDIPEELGLSKDDDLAFDMDVDPQQESLDNLYSIEINPDDLDFLSYAVTCIAKSPDSIYDREKFEKQLKAHPILVDYANREKYCQRNNLSLKRDETLFALKVKLKKMDYPF